jgi:hypothetical protein
MRLKYNNIFILAAVIVLAVVVIMAGFPGAAFFKSMTQIGPEHSDMDQILGLLAWVLMIALFIVTVRALINRKNN